MTNVDVAVIVGGTSVRGAGAACPNTKEAEMIIDAETNRFRKGTPE